MGGKVAGQVLDRLLNHIVVFPGGRLNHAAVSRLEGEGHLAGKSCQQLHGHFFLNGKMGEISHVEAGLADQVRPAGQKLVQLDIQFILGGEVLFTDDF